MLRFSVVVYGAGMLQGFAFTLLPALATVFAAGPYHVGAKAFGALFLPLTIGAIAGAVATPPIAARKGMMAVLRLGVVANLIALLSLIVSTRAGPVAYDLLLVDTAALGIGFGLNFSAVNDLASLLPPNATDAVTFANVFTGLGTSLTPLIVGGFLALHAWPLWPAILGLAFVAVLLLSRGCDVARAPDSSRATHRRVSAALVAFGIAALLYAFCEGTFSSWATTFVHVDRRFSLAAGEAALTGFWLALTVTRLVAAPAQRFLPPRVAFVAFPLAIAVAFLLLPLWQGATILVCGFILGGIACSIVFPYAVSLALAALPEDGDRIAGTMVAALMGGEGLGTFVVGLLRDDAGISLRDVYRGAAAIAVALSIAAVLALRAAPESAVKSSR